LTLQYRYKERITVSFKKVIDRGGVLRNRLIPRSFAKSRLASEGARSNGRGGLDFCADALWFEAHGGMGDLQQVVVDASV
jgi:hypothetical protein